MKRQMATAQSATHDALNGPATVYHDLGDTGLRDDDAQSLSNVRGVIDREDASTQCDDEDMALQHQPPHTGKDWSKELPLSTESPSSKSKSTAKGTKKTIRDMRPVAKRIRPRAN